MKQIDDEKIRRGILRFLEERETELAREEYAHLHSEEHVRNLQRTVGAWECGQCDRIMHRLAEVRGLIKTVKEMKRPAPRKAAARG